MNRYTPGPWRVGEEQPIRDMVNVRSNAAYIADCYQSVVVSENENQANARLIAAAPEMAEVLKEYCWGSMHAPKANRFWVDYFTPILRKAGVLDEGPE